MSTTDFDWTTDVVVFPSTQGVAVYQNAQGNLVIRQQQSALEEEDTWIGVPIERANALAGAIRELAKKHRQPRGGRPH